MSIGSLSAQFSDVRKADFTGGPPVPPAQPAASRPVRQTRVGQTIWCCVDAESILAFDAYLLIRPIFRVPGTEYLPAPGASSLASPVKRRDVIGSPSPFGGSLSDLLGDIWRFFMPAGSSRSFAFFLPAEGLEMWVAPWVTDLNGVEIPGAINIAGDVWTAVGSAHALSVSAESGSES